MVHETFTSKELENINNIFGEIENERIRQQKKWGQQNHPSVDQTLLNREGGCSPERMCEEYNIASDTIQRNACDAAAKNGQITYAHILAEEFSESICCLGDEDKLREELIQVAAVTVAWIEAIDRRKNQ